VSSDVKIGAGRALDEAAAIGRRDAGGMFGRIADMPRQMREARHIGRGLQLPDSHRATRAAAVLGMGGSAIAGDLLRGIFADRLRAPLMSVRDYDLPAWVDRQTLVIAVSHSGATEETIAALSAALERRCPVIVITTGGPMRDVADRVELPRLVYPNQSPPRAAIGYSLVLLAAALEAAGMLDLADEELEAGIEAAASAARAFGPDSPTEGNIAKQLAWTLVGRLPVVEGSGHLAPVARRWKAQLNENAKSLAVAEELPEATHNTVVGYEQPDGLHDHLYVLFLAGALDHPRNNLRASLSSELLAAVGVSYQTVAIPGEGRLGQACAGITLGDYVSTYLALLYGIDPTPVDAIDHVKGGMSAADLGDD
jgi:glucose/mannose-6-phosphate isomerase